MALAYFVRIFNVVVRYIYCVMNAVFSDNDDTSFVISELKEIKVNY